MQRLTADRTDFLIAIVSINVTSRLMSYLHMNESRQMPAWHYHVQAQRCQFKAFCRLNSQSKQTFFILHAQALCYVFNRWHKTMDPDDKKLTDFKELIHEAVTLIDSLLYREVPDSCS